MRSDLVIRLRGHKYNVGRYEYRMFCEAADEIERLRKFVVSLENFINEEEQLYEQSN